MLSDDSLNKWAQTVYKGVTNGRRAVSDSIMSITAWKMGFVKHTAPTHMLDVLL